MSDYTTRRDAALLLALIRATILGANITTAVLGLASSMMGSLHKASGHTETADYLFTQAIALGVTTLVLCGTNFVLWRVEKAAAGIASPATEGGHDDALE